MVLQSHRLRQVLHHSGRQQHKLVRSEVNLPVATPIQAHRRFQTRRQLCPKESAQLDISHLALTISGSPLYLLVMMVVTQWIALAEAETRFI